MEVKIVGDYSAVQGPEPIKPTLRALKETRQLRISDDVLVVSRAPKPEDIPFILDSSVLSLQKYKNTIWAGWDEEYVRKYLHNTLIRALTSGYFTMLIACKSNNEDEIVGYIVGNQKRNEILLQYTKFIYRGCKIQKHFLLPFLVDFKRPIYTQYATHYNVKMAKAGKLTVRDFLNEYAWDCFDHYQQLLQEKAA